MPNYVHTAFIKKDRFIHYNIVGPNNKVIKCMSTNNLILIKNQVAKALERLNSGKNFINVYKTKVELFNDET